MEWPAAYRWWSRVLTGFAILAAEAFWVRSTGIKDDIGGAGSLLVGPNQFFRLIVLPFLLTLLYVAVVRFRGAQYRGVLPSWPSRRSVAAHILCFLAFTGLTQFLNSQGAGYQSTIWAALWFCAGVATGITGILAAFDPSVISPSSLSAAFTVIALTAASLIAMPLVERSWDYDYNVTVNASTALLQHIGVQAWSVGKLIYTPHFKVIISPACSGYEGICLFLAFAITWLAWFRKEYRFPAALLVLPVGVAVSWCLNVVRISAYVLIGHFGHKDVAMNGFHSWAGVIAFTMLALAFCSVSPRIPVISNLPAQPKLAAAETATDPIFYFLGPFLAMQAASMLSRAASGGMEWLYPMRVLAAVAVIWAYRKRYAAIDWGRRPSVWAAATGLGAALLWAASSWRFASNFAPSVHLAQVSLAWRATWLGFRIAGGVLLAPLVEELAFRGFLMRRVQSAAFESLDARRCGWLAIAVSALVFGLLHGPRFLEGAAAGAIYGYLYSRTGKLGDAFFAHALTNLLLALAVAATGDWRYW